MSGQDHHVHLRTGSGSDHLTTKRIRNAGTPASIPPPGKQSDSVGANKIAVRRNATTKAMLKVRPVREQLLHDALTTGDDTWLLLERNSEDGEYTRQQIQTPP